MGFDSGIFSLTIYYCLTETFSISKFASPVFGQTQFFKSIGGNRVCFYSEKSWFWTDKCGFHDFFNKRVWSLQKLCFFLMHKFFFSMFSSMGVSFNKYTLFERSDSIKRRSVQLDFFLTNLYRFLEAVVLRIEFSLRQPI